jgi:hypothetical protein
MSEVAISRIALDTAGSLRVYPRPASVDYEWIWRDASSVRWDEADRSLYVLPVDGFTAVDEFRQIIKAVKGEYLDSLFVDESTDFAVRAELAGELREIAEVRS